MTFRSIALWSLKLFSIACWAIWSVFTLGMTAVSMYNVLKGDAPFFQGAIYAGMCGIGLGFLVSYIPRRFVMKRDCQKAAEMVLGDFKSGLVHTAKIREKINAEFDLMIECLMEGDPEEATLHQTNLRKLQENFEAVWNEHFALFDTGKKDEPKTSS